MSTAVHRIRRQRWALKAGSERDALSIRRQLREVWETGALPAFEAAFDEVAPGPEIVRFRRLEVSVTVRDVDALVDVLQERVRQALRRILDTAMAAAAAPAVPEDEAVAVERGQAGVLAHYLRAGSVPWHATERDSTAAIRALEHEARASLEVALAELRGIAGDEPALAAGLFRLLQLLPEERWRVVADRFLGAAMDPPLAVIELLDEITGSKGGSIPRHGRIRLVADLIAAVATMVRRDEAANEPAVVQVIRAVVSAWMRQTGSPPPVNVVAVLERWPGDPEPLGEPATGAGDADRPAVSSPAPGPAARRTAVASTAKVDVAEPSRGTRGDMFPLAVASAGLVLLHPYLSQLFQAVGIVLAADMPAESSAAARAAALLHLLASGRDEPYELELGFIKVLLGLTPETALPAAGGLLGDADRDEADALLQAVVGHWTALKHTSVGALRASFLQRTGLLGKDENGWRLRIEPGPFDVLLDRLPWGIGTVKLPWMSRPIYCEWPTA